MAAKSRIRLRGAKATRHLPIVFVDGEPEKVKRTRLLLPDATYTTWGRIKTALPKAIAQAAHRIRSSPITTLRGQAARRQARRQAGLQGGAARLAERIRRHAQAAARRRSRSRRGPNATADLFLCFARSRRELHAHLLPLQGVADRQTMWLVWPKKASGVKSDLDGNVVRTTGLAAGWVDYKVCSVDDTWSGLAFKRRK